MSNAPARPRRLCPWCAAAVWLLFASSFFMHATNGSYSVRGWDAFGMYFITPWRLQEYWQAIEKEPLMILSTAFTPSSIGVFLAPLVLWKWRRWAGWLGFALVLGACAPAIMFWSMWIKRELGAGFFCWDASILLMGLLCWRTAGWRFWRPLSRPR